MHLSLFVLISKLYITSMYFLVDQIVDTQFNYKPYLLFMYIYCYELQTYFSLHYNYK
jgi:hypothetical protein